METRISEVSEDNAKFYSWQQLLLAMGYKQKDIDKSNLQEMSNEEFQQLLRDKMIGAMNQNGPKQRIVSTDDVEKNITKDYDFEAVFPNRKAVMRLRILVKEI
ncbi:MAG: hypothetical protein QXH93_04670 [Conexivisphaerales archaeon]